MPVKLVTITLLDNGHYVVRFFRDGVMLDYGFPNWESVQSWLKDHAVKS